MTVHPQPLAGTGMLKTTPYPHNLCSVTDLKFHNVVVLIIIIGMGMLYSINLLTVIKRFCKVLSCNNYLGFT